MPAMRAAVLSLVVAVCAGLVACAAAPDSAGSTARTFVQRFAARDLGAAAAVTDASGPARAGLEAAWEGLRAESMTASIGAVHTDGDTARADYTYEWTLPGGRTWAYEGSLALVRSEGHWSVRWEGSAVHPRLGAARTLALRIGPVPRAPVLGHDGTPVFTPGFVYVVGVSAAAAGDGLPAAATALARVLGPVAPGVRAQDVAERASSAGGEYEVVRLTQGQFEEVGDGLDGIDGVSVSKQPVLVPADPGLSNDVFDGLSDVVADDVAGARGWSVVVLNRDGGLAGTLTRTAPVPAPAVRVSIDARVQSAAQRAVDGVGEQAALVAIEPSTGGLLAVAQNGAADAEGPIALQGLYPPGSTFKMVTAGAAIDTGLATPQTMLSCPGEVTVGTRTIPNYAHFALGTVPMRTAFAASCNTTFAELASRMGAHDLPDAAARYGIGVDYAIPGVTTVTGDIRPAQDVVVRSEDGFGQGLDLVSPFGMALAAATVANGRTPVPEFVSGAPAEVTGADGAITPEMVDGLRLMMRQVVTSGTGSSIADEGEVYGKTGEAEFDGGSHAWFAGYRGDIAFATLIVSGGSSDNAVAVTRSMFEALPDGYMS